MVTAGRAYWSPYVAGAALGLIVAVTYVLLGYGPGASGAFAHVAARVEGALAPSRAAANPFLVGYLESGRLWAQWVVIEVVGIALGGLLGAWSAGRLAWRFEAGPRIGRGRRLLFAFLGGATVGLASRIAQGCTSGLALSGGAVFAPGAWAFTAAFMVGGFVAATLARRLWR
jgi:uncharacterized membrane protein YedE/YeeE